MSDKSEKKERDEKAGAKTMTAAVAGAVIGAGIAIAGTVALKEENRQKMKATVGKLKNQAEDYIKDLSKKAKDTKEDLKDSISEKKKDVEKAVDDTKDSLRASKNK